MAESLLSSEMLAKIIDGSPIASFVINKQHKVTHWNIAVEALSGIKREEIIGTDEQWRAFYAKKRPVMADLIVDKAPANTIEAYYRGKCKKTGLIDGAYEAEDFFPDLGRTGRWLHFTASPIRDDNGEIIGAIETLEDISERKVAEDNLRYYLREITRAQEAERKRIARELHDDTAQLWVLFHGNWITSFGRSTVLHQMKSSFLKTCKLSSIVECRVCSASFRIYGHLY